MRFIRRAATRARRSLAAMGGAREELAELRARVSSYERGWAPGHFYSPIPSLEEVSRRESTIFAAPRRSLPGIDLRESYQLKVLADLAFFYRDNPFTRAEGSTRFRSENPNFSVAEAVILHGMVRRAQPQRIIEVGSGYSSCAILDTNEHFFADAISCTFIDPHADLLRSLLRDSDEGRITIVDSAVQDVELTAFEGLRSGDIFFIDSSHVVKVGSDVNWIMFEVLPRLAPGVIVHFHDIYYPFEYPREWVYQGRAWNEVYLVRALLEYSSEFSVLFFNSFIGRFHEDTLRQSMPECAHPGSSLWLQIGQA